jgi:nucleoside-diphosphate-sugar epimerase
MVGSLDAAVRRLPCLPIIGNGEQVLHLIHSEDLCRFVFQLATEPFMRPLGPVTLAHEQGFTFRDILKIIARGQGKAPASIPIPAGCLYAVLKTAEALGFRGRLRSDSLQSLMHYDPSPSFTEMRRLGFVPRLFSERTLREDAD